MNCQKRGASSCAQATRTPRSAGKKMWKHSRNMAMNQYLLIPFLVGWTSIYQLFLCSPGVQGFDPLPYPEIVNQWDLNYESSIQASNFMNHGSLFFPTCQVRVVRFYVSCLLLPPPDSCLVLLLLSSSSSSSSSSSLSSLSSRPCSTATRDPQCSLPDLNHDHPCPVFPAGPQPRPSPPSVPCRTSTTTIHAQCSLPDLNREYPRQVYPAGPYIGR